jgi:photosystem II stability/assembly factor-like uncharacterized protein
MALASEAAGLNCTYGGTKVTAGLDTSGNNVLDAFEVTSTSFNCNGAPGAGITWANITGAVQQAVSGVGYLANNASEVNITLPTNPVVGDLFEVSGVGSGGWRIAQNAGQTVMTRGLPASYEYVHNEWVPRTAEGSWRAVASSADGIRLVGVGAGGIYNSADAGATWVASFNTGDWQSVASSSDGSKLVVVRTGEIMTSSDSGTTWNSVLTLDREWKSVASSADGSKLVAVARPGSELWQTGDIYTSNDWGNTWTNHGPRQSWRSVASSADGSKLVAVAYFGQIYTSTDSGDTWTARDIVRFWSGVASSADGNKLVAVEQGGQIFTSTDSGVTWTDRNYNKNWSSVTSSADGVMLAATGFGMQLYTSTDSGLNWSASDVSRTWSGLASSADGKNLVAVQFYGPLYTSGAYQRSTTGVAGALRGSQYDAIKLQYAGGGIFMPLSYVSYSGSFKVQ